MSIEDRVKKIVSDQLGTSLDEIQSDSSFVDDLGADSLDTVELVMALEEEFDLVDFVLGPREDQFLDACNGGCWNLA